VLGEIEVEKSFWQKPAFPAWEWCIGHVDFRVKAIPRGTEKFRFALDVALRTTALSLGAKSKMASLELNRGKCSFRLLHVMSGQGVMS